MDVLRRLLLAHMESALFAWGLAKALLPFPTPSLLMVAGAAVGAQGRPAAALASIGLRIALPAALGITLGSFPYYALARRGGSRALERFAALLKVRMATVRRLETLMARKRGRLIFTLRLVPVVPVAFGSLLGGVAASPVWEFTLWTFLGSALRCELLAAMGAELRGVYSGAPWRALPGGAAPWALAGSAAVALWLARRRTSPRRGR